MQEKTCNDCGGTYPLNFFRRSHHTRMVHHPRCRGCEQLARDEPKKKNRLRTKAVRAIVAHARRLPERWGVKSTEDLINDFGWSPDQMTRDLEQIWKYECPYCEIPFKDMGGGPPVMTFDVVDRDRPPHYRTNVTICCATCNKSKQDKTPEEWEENLRNWRKWKEQQKKLGVDPWYGTLFEKKEE